MHILRWREQDVGVNALGGDLAHLDDGLVNGAFAVNKLLQQFGVFPIERVIGNGQFFLLVDEGVAGYPVKVVIKGIGFVVNNIAAAETAFSRQLKTGLLNWAKLIAHSARVILRL